MANAMQTWEKYEQEKNENMKIMENYENVI